MGNLRKVIVWAVVIAVLLWFSIGFIPWLLFAQGSEAGTFGDSFGFVNSFFSGLALGGVIIAIILQSHELRLQREELEATREELRKSAEAHAASQEALKDQADSLFLAAYLNALDAVRETPPPEELPPSQWETTERMNAIVRRLEDRATSILGEPVQIRSRHEWIAERVKRIGKLLRVEWKAHPNRTNAEVAATQEALRRAQNEYRKLLPEMSEAFEDQSIYDIQNRLTELSVRDVKMGGRTDEVEKAFEVFRANISYVCDQFEAVAQKYLKACQGRSER